MTREDMQHALQRGIEYLPAPVRLGAVRTVASLATRTWRREDATALAPLIAALLHEPPSRANQIARRLFANNREFLALFAALSQGRRDVFAHALARAELSGGDEFRHFHRRDPRPLVLLSIHMGHYVVGLAKIREFRREVPCFALRRPSGADAELFGHFRESGIDLQILGSARSSSTAAVRALRSGASVFAMIDLDHSFGRTAAVQMLGAPLHLTRGPIEIAIIGRAVIVPFVVFRERARDRVEFASPISCRPLPAERLADSTARIARQVASLAERWIRAHPDQWWHWGQLPRMFHPSAQAEQEMVAHARTAMGLGGEGTGRAN